MDLGIVGGGPAGAMAAIEAARSGLRVVMWDGATFPRDKVCGEFLSPESIPLLAKVIPATLGRAVAIRRAEFHSKKGRRLSIAFPSPGAGLSRLLLDDTLWRAAEAAGVVCRQAEPVARIVRLGAAAADPEARWQVTSATANSIRVCELLLACGRWWKVDGLPSPALSSSTTRCREGNWVGAKAHFAGIDARDAVEMYFFQGGYCGLAPVEDRIYNACFLVHQTVARSYGGRGMADFRAWINNVAGHVALAARLRNAAQVSETIATAPARPARRSPEVEGALAAGDTAGFLDPFTGDGISMALHSGHLAAREIARGFRHKSSRGTAKRYRIQLAQNVGRSYFCAALLRALVRAPAELQDWLAAVTPTFIGSKLLSATRWQALELHGTRPGARLRKWR
jgi:flavin-dependent dehydrogenase